MALFSGDNGGSTWRGVSPDKVIVARWIPLANPATDAALVAAGVSDEREDLERMTKVLFHYNNNHFETYGREVVYVNVEATGPETDETSQRADAVRIAEEVGAFAAYGAPAYAAEELAHRGVICICALEQGREYYARVRHRVFSTLLVMEEYYLSMAEYQGKRLAGKPAQWAGDPLLRAQTRKFGLIWPETATLAGAHGGGMKAARDFYVAELARWGAELTEDVAYQYDLTRAGEQSVNIITRMKSAGVTTLAFAGDPLTPAFVTREATRQAYFPEWFIAGTLLTDISFFGRTYDQVQWRHAFGQSPIWVTWENIENSAGYREYHHACRSILPPEDCEPGDEGVSINSFRSNPYRTFIGIHMAGPNLTPDTFAQGKYAYPPTGGLPTLPLYYWTPESPTAIKDLTEVFYDSEARGRDEAGKDGVGMILKVDGGRRYPLGGGWPDTEPRVFDREGTIAVSDEPSESFPHEQDGHNHAGRRCRSCPP